MESGVTFGAELYNNDYSNCVLPLDDGYIIGGHTENFLWAVDTNVQKDDAFYLKVNLNGDTVWHHTFGIRSVEQDVISKVIERNNELYFVGVSEIDTNQNLRYFNSLFFKTTELGDVIVYNEYNYSDFDYIIDIKEYGSSFLILSYKESYQNIYGESCLSKVDSTGQVLWHHCYADPSYHYGAGSIEFLNNSIYLVGSKLDTINPFLINVLQLDSFGGVISSSNYSNDNSHDVRTGNWGNTGTFQDENGIHLIITGAIDLDQYNRAGYIISVDENGVKEWERTYDAGPQNEAFLSAQVLENGRIVTTSFRRNYEIGSANTLCWLVMYDKHGDLVWERFISAYNDLNAETYPYQVKTALDGGFVVTGYVINNQIQTNGIFNRNDAWLAKTDSCGFTTNNPTEALLVVDSIVNATVCISNLSADYCTGSYTINGQNGVLDSMDVYAYSQWTNGVNPNQMQYTFQDTGAYEITINIIGGDSTDSYTVQFNILDTISSVEPLVAWENQIHIFPNPVKDYLVVQTELSLNNNSYGKLSADLYTTTGRKITSYSLDPQRYQQIIFIDDITNGVYLLNFTLDSRSIGNKRINVVK